MSDTMFDAMFGAAIAGGGSGGGFTPTEAQLTAMNSGITSTDVEQITTNKNNILLKQDIIDSSHKLSADLVDDSSATNKFATSAQLQQIETNKSNIILNAKNGKANYINAPDTTISGSGYVFNNLTCNIPAGEYYLKYTSTQENSGNAETIVRDTNDTIICDVTIVSKTGNNIIPLTLSATGTTFTVFSVRAGTYSNFMIIPKSLYDTGITDYQPYAMTNAEITAWILSQT